MPTLSCITPDMFSPKVYYCSKDYTIQSLYELAKQHKLSQAYKTLGEYYRGKHVILGRTFENDETKPNNKLVHNFPKLIVDNSVSYFMGKPVKYSTESSEYLNKLTEVLDYNNETDVNSELAKLGAIYGHAFEVLWIDKEGQIRFKQVSPACMFICYSLDIAEEPVVAVSYREVKSEVDNETHTLLSVYTETAIEEYNVFEDKNHETSIQKLSSTPHYFGGIPVIEYPVNNERIGDFETVLSLIDAYNIACSDSVNDINYMNDAYLMLKGLSMSDESDVEDMKQNRILLVDGEFGDASWLVKNINDTHIQNIKNRLVEDIHKFSMTPNLADEKFASNLSGVAISYKLIGLENKTAGKERKFATALRQRVRLITNVLNIKGGAYNPTDIEPIFTRNIPQNLTDIVNAVVSLQGIVPKKMLISLLSFVNNPEEAIKELEQEQDKEMEKSYSYLDNQPDYDMEEGVEDEQEDKASAREVFDRTSNTEPRGATSKDNPKTTKAKKKAKNNN